MVRARPRPDGPGPERRLGRPAQGSRSLESPAYLGHPAAAAVPGFRRVSPARVRPSSAGAAASKLRPSGRRGEVGGSPGARPPRTACARTPAPCAPEGGALLLSPPPPPGRPVTQSPARGSGSRAARQGSRPLRAAGERTKSAQLRRGRARSPQRPRRRPARRCLPRRA